MLKLLLATVLASSIAPQGPAIPKPVPSHRPAAPADAPQAGKAAKPKREPVAVVNGVALMDDRLGSAMNELMPFGSFHVGVNPQRAAEIRQQALDKIIDEELQYQAAQRVKLVASRAAVDAEYAKVRRRYKTHREFLDACRRAGVTTTDVRFEVRRRVLATLVRERALKGRCSATESEAKAYYAQNTAKFVMPEQLRVSTLTIGTQPTSTRDEWDAAKKKADNLAGRIRGGADFAALAREHSTDPNKAKGGDLGFVHRGRLAEEFEKALEGAKVGTLVGPVQTIYGFHLLRITETRPPDQKSYADVRVKLLADLGERKCADAARAWTAGLRAEATIVIPPTPQAGAVAGQVPPAVK